MSSHIATLLAGASAPVALWLLARRAHRRRLAAAVLHQNRATRRRWVSAGDRHAAASLEAARTQALEDLANMFSAHLVPIPGEPLLEPRPRSVRFLPSKRQLRAARSRVLPVVQHLGHGPIVNATVDWDTLSVTLVSRTASVPLVLCNSSHLAAASELAFRLQREPMNYLIDARDALMSFHFLSMDQGLPDISLRGFPIPLQML